MWESNGSSITLACVSWGFNSQHVTHVSKSSWVRSSAKNIDDDAFGRQKLLLLYWFLLNCLRVRQLLMLWRYGSGSSVSLMFCHSYTTTWTWLVHISSVIQLYQHYAMLSVSLICSPLCISICYRVGTSSVLIFSLTLTWNLNLTLFSKLIWIPDSVCICYSFLFTRLVLDILSISILIFKQIL